MRKFILCLIVLCWSAGTSAAVLNDADAFVIARSAKLGEMEDSFSSGKQVTKKIGCAPGEADCVGPTLCKTDSQCKDDEYCSVIKQCTKLCSGGVNSDGEKCSDYPRMPECTPTKNGHKSYCACTDTSCGTGWKCAEQNGIKQCVICSAGEACGCPDGKMSNGKGGCGGCNTNEDCAGNETCADAGTIEAECKTITCPDGTFPKDHDCVKCSALDANCLECSETQCVTCLPAYDLVDGKCVLKTCPDGQYLDELTGTCNPCGAGCKKCTSADVCTECESAYDLENGACKTKNCGDGMYLNMETGECLSCSAECATCTNVANDGETSQCVTCADGYHMADGVCVANGCADMKLATECGANQIKTDAGVATNGEQCWSCADPEPECRKDTDCDGTQKCSPDGECVLKTCAEMGYEKTCSAGYLKNEAAVGSDGMCYTCQNPAKDCPADKPAWDGKKCVQCTANSHCESYEYCKDNQCVLQAGKCYTSKDCINADYCKDHSCVPACDPNPCSDKTPTCYGVSHEPVCYCTTTSCGTGYECDGTKCKSLTCKSDNDCTRKKMCSGGKCVDPCSSNPCSDKTPTCIAVDHKPTCYCTPTSCGTGYECDVTKCKSLTCKSDNDCHRNKMCSGGKCVDPCSSNPCSGKTPKCIAVDHEPTCYCTQTSCGEGYKCESTVCKMKTTEKCTTDDDCSADKKCSDGYCVYRE